MCRVARPGRSSSFTRSRCCRKRSRTRGAQSGRRSTCPETPAVEAKILRQLELDGDLVGDGARPAVQLKGLVTPLPHSTGGRFGEERLATRHLYGVHVAIFSHQHIEHDCAFNSLQTRLGGINRLYFVGEPAAGDSQRDRNRHERENRVRVYNGLRNWSGAASSHCFGEVGRRDIDARGFWWLLRGWRRRVGDGVVV